MASPKQEVYQLLLQWGLSGIRNVQSQSAWNKSRDKSCYHEAELLHTISHSILEPEFVAHDFWFLNHHCKAYVEHAKGTSNYPMFNNLICELFAMVPATQREELEWSGPEVIPVPKVPAYKPIHSKD